MKLLFVIDSLVIGGKERRLIQLIKGLNNRNIDDIHVAIFDNDVYYKYVYDYKVTIHCLDRKSPRDIQVGLKLYKIIKSINPDIIQSWSLMSSFWLNIIRLFVKFNYISAYVANCNKPKRFSIGDIARYFSILESKIIVSNSKAGLDAYDIPKKKSLVIYNGFDFQRVSNLKKTTLVRENLNIETPFLVTMIARVSESKDYNTYIEAARLLFKERNDVTFLAVGDGPQLNSFRNKLSISEKKYIRFIGARTDIEDILNSSDISVLCTYTEGISNSILESMALGIPVIASSGGGTSEIVIDNETGFIVESKNIEQLSSKINTLLENPSLRFIFGSKAKEVVASKFTLDKMCDAYYNLYQNTLLNK